MLKLQHDTEVKLQISTYVCMDVTHAVWQFKLDPERSRKGSKACHERCDICQGSFMVENSPEVCLACWQRKIEGRCDHSWRVGMTET